jgi:hypothetical protein
LTDPEAPPLACFGTPSEKRTRGDAAQVVSMQERGIPWRDETQERIGSHRRVKTADRSTDFRTGLKPLKARLETPTLSRVTPNPLLGAAEDDTRQRGKAPGSDTTPRRRVDNNATRGKGCREASRQFGRENL